MRERKLVVAALARDSDGRTLLTQRRADQAMPLKWEFPGGKVEPGESPAVALAREVREELGVGCTVGEIYEVVFHAYPDFDLYMLVYACTLDGAPRPVEVAALAWVEPPRLTDYDVLPADRPLILRLQRQSCD